MSAEKQKLNVVVTGASRGIGLAIAGRLLEKGHRVIGVSRKMSDAFRDLQATRGAGDLDFFAYDLAKLDGLHELVKEITRKHGHLYGLVNNAAIGHDGVLATMHDSQIVELMNVNLTSTILMTKYASRSMLLKGKGRIVSISSVAAFTGYNGLVAYSATKSGLIGFTRALSRELGKARVTVNAVAPGFVETDMTQGLAGDKLESIRRRSALGRLARPEDVANAVAFLISEDAESITGTVLPVDAGSIA